ncbi:MAG: sensor histidine kinase [Nocardioides sp.]
MTPLRLGHGGRPVSMFGLLARFTLAGLVVLAVVAAVIAGLARQAGTRQAVDAAEQVTWVSASGIAAPLLTDAAVDGDPEALARLHRAMDEHVLAGSLVRIKIWDEDGRIVYSNDSRLIGRTFDLGDEELVALRTGRRDSGISDLGEPENTYERRLFEKLLEVYVGIESTSGRPLLFETYFKYSDVARAGQEQWRQFAPATLGGLVLLELFQIPAAWSLARRLQRQQHDRQRLIQLAADSAGSERRRIAADIHDGIVQDLTGAALALDAARLGRPDPVRDRALIENTAGILRSGVKELRALLVDLYPPDLAEEGLVAALQEIGAGLERVGIRVTMTADDEVDRLPQAVMGVLFRAAQELFRNVEAHSRAAGVDLVVTLEAGWVRMTVEDDGLGFDEEAVARGVAQGHLGLRALSDLVIDAGGEVSVRSAAGQGTLVEISIPANIEPAGERS